VGLADRKSSSNGLVPAAAASAQPVIGPALTRDVAGQQAASVTMDAVPLQTSETQSPVVNNVSRDANHSKLRTVPTTSPMVSARDYMVRSGEHFAEIRIHRSSRVDGDAPFVWWNEAASAKPGIDYVSQGKAIQSFQKGKNSTSFFVKLFPNATRTQPEVFYIAIAARGHGSSGQIARAAVWLPINHDQSQVVADRGDMR
jgi:hypothetical protein